VTFADGTWQRDRTILGGTRIQARNWGLERERALLEGKDPTKKPAVMTVGDFAPIYIAGHHEASLHKASGTDAVKRILDVHVVPFIGQVPLDKVTDDVIADLRTKWVKGGYITSATGDRVRIRTILGTTSRKTHNNRLSVVSSLLKVAVAWKSRTGLSAMPCTIKLSPVDVNREPPFYDHGDYERLVIAAAALDPRLLVLVLLAGEAGLRRGEVTGLNLSDVDFTHGRLTVRRSVWVHQGRHITDEPKGMRRLPVPTTPRLLAALQAVRHLRGERVLYDDVGAELTPKMIRTWVERIEKKANMPITGRLHVLRHTFASHAAMAGVPAKTIQELARHSTLLTTMRYMHLSPSAKDEGIAMLARSRATGGGVVGGRGSDQDASTPLKKPTS
jgi:integrase